MVGPARLDDRGYTIETDLATSRTDHRFPVQPSSVALERSLPDVDDDFRLPNRTPSAFRGQALKELTDQYPALHPHLFSEEGELRAFVNLFLNDEDIRHLQGQATPLKEGDRLMILPSIAGGH